MSFAERLRRAACAGLAAALAACGGGSSSTTTITGPGGDGGTSVAAAHQDTPTGDNTTQIVIDDGPSGAFALGAVNVPYVTVTVCAPGSTTQCATIDHVFLDTGSIGLRVLASKVAGLGLPAVAVAPDSATSTPAGTAVECYPFVLGAAWGPLAIADVQVAGERAGSLPVQVIDDASPPVYPVPADCTAAANGQLMDSAASLQANGIMGIGMLAYDCGATCANADYAGGYALYYSCTASAGCAPAAMAVDAQVHNPVAAFPVDNNGTVILLPALPELGAGTATGRLVFGIGTRANNQLPTGATTLFVDPDPTHADYLYFSTRTATGTYPDSYIDSGSNAYFFADAALPANCQDTTGGQSSWYCPTGLLQRSAVVADVTGASATIDYRVTNADALFSTSSLALDDLAGSVSGTSSSFVWGLPFFYARAVYTSIWGQALSENGPWNAF
ncbi:MAG: DUF3443 family protein [Burkholderiaceae bacterium]